MDVDKTVLNAKSLPDNVDKNLSSDDVISSYSALKRSTYREIQRRRAKEEGEGFEGYVWKFPDLRSENSDGKEEILSGALGGNPKKLTPEEVAAEGRIRKSNDAPIQVQTLGMSSATIMYRTLFLKLCELQAHACRLYFSVKQIITLWQKFYVPPLKDRSGRTILQQIDPAGTLNRNGATDATSTTDSGAGNFLCDLHKDILLIRMELLMSLFSRIVDIENLPEMLDK